MIRSDLCDYSDYSDAYIFVGGTIIITGEGDDDTAKSRWKRKKCNNWKLFAIYKVYK